MYRYSVWKVALVINYSVYKALGIEYTLEIEHARQRFNIYQNLRYIIAGIF